MKVPYLSTAVIVCLGVSVLAQDAPQQINYQCKVEKAGVPFDGVGQFKFAIVDQAGTNTYWSNDGTSVAGSAPSNAVALNVKGGLLSVPLGNAAIPNMTVVPASVFEQQDRHVRIWFGGKTGPLFERLLPDNPLSSVPYAMVAQSVPDDTITGRKLTRESVWPVHEGRDNTIVTYFSEYTGAAGLVSLGTIASNKNYIITDIVFGPAAASPNFCPSDLEVRYRTNAVDTILFKQKTVVGGADFQQVPCSLQFRSGLAVPAGAELLVRNWGVGSSYAHSCTISGFEIPVE